MARPTKEAASPSPLAPALVRHAAARGVDPAAFAERLGFERALGERDEAFVTSHALVTMLTSLADVLAEPHLGLRLPAELAYRRYDAVTLAVRAASTPREVAALLSRYAALVFPQLEIRVDGLLPGGELSIGASLRGYPRGPGLLVDEYLVALSLGHCRRGGADVVPTEVRLSSARPKDLAPLFRAFGTREIVFGSESTGFTLRRDDADRLLSGADPVLVATAEHLAASSLASAPKVNALAATVEAKIEALLPGDVGTATIADALHMSARTLQRRLEDEGTSFSEVFDAVRERVSRRLLAGDLPLAEVAYRAGFSDVPTFSRAFKRWTGVPPGAFRRAPR